MAKALSEIKKIIAAQSALDSAGIAPPSEAERADFMDFLVVFGAGTSAGAVVIEEAHDPAYTGVWAVLATITWAVTANKVFSARVVGGAHAIRARIGTAIVGGTVDVHFWAQKGD
jgi:hypothetical protein